MENMKILSFEKGFTLIEVMIVLVIMGGIVALGMPYLSSRNSKTKGYLRELTVLSRELHTKAKLQGVVFRLVISMPGENAQGKRLGQVYWVEKANGGTVMKANEEEEAMERAKETDPAKQVDPNGFTSISNSSKLRVSCRRE